MGLTQKKVMVFERIGKFHFTELTSLRWEEGRADSEVNEAGQSVSRGRLYLKPYASCILFPGGPPNLELDSTQLPEKVAPKKIYHLKGQPTTIGEKRLSRSKKG